MPWSPQVGKEEIEVPLMPFIGEFRYCSTLRSVAESVSARLQELSW